MFNWYMRVQKNSLVYTSLDKYEKIYLSHVELMVCRASPNLSDEDAEETQI